MFRTIRKIRSSAQFARLSELLASLKSGRRANVAVTTALAALPMITAIGCVIDYSNASMTRTKLEAAADAASLATVSINSPVIATAKTMSGNGAVTGGSTYASNFFSANLPSSYTSLSPTVTVTKTAGTVTAVVSFSTTVPTYFMGIIGYPNITISNSSTATYSLPVYISFYLMLDASGSMSFPSTAAEQARLQAVNPDNMTGSNGYPGGCTFACHFTQQGACPQNGNPGQGPIPAAGKPTNPNSGGYCQGFIISRLGTSPVSFANGTTNTTNGNNVNWNNAQVSSCANPGTTSCIQLRADAVGSAVTSLLKQAVATEASDGVANQFQVGLYPFIVNMDTNFSPLTSTISSGSAIYNAATQLANQLDTGQNAALGSGGTHFENAFTSINNLITTVGTGTGVNNTLPYVFVITDGSQDYQTQWNGNWGSLNWSASAQVPFPNSATVIPPNSVDSTAYCTNMKKRGITIAVLYIPYQTIQNANANFANNEDGYANSNIANIPTALQNCASPNFFYTANTPTDIQNALLAMFQQVVSTAFISQ
jgi:Flp pilus assembly protein TadG